MRKLVKNVIAPLIVLGVAVAIAVLMVKSRSELPRREREAAPPVVETLVAHPGPVPVSIRSRGIVTPRLSTEIVSEVAGRVVWVAPGFWQGAEVREGQELLRIDPIDYEVALSDARAALAGAELSLAEVQVVVKKAAIEEAEARVAAARDRLRQAEIDLQNTRIRAPFNAVVDFKRVDFGQYLQPGTPVMKLLGTDLAEVRLPLLAADVPYVSYGQDEQGEWLPVTLTASFGTAQFSWQARIARLERRVDAETRVFFLVAEVDHPYDLALHQRALVMGLFVEASFTGGNIEEAVRLPRSALHNSSNVYVVRDGRIYRQAVELLRREEDSVIVHGLGDGQRVVLSRLGLMFDGMAVSVES